jgi:hypothetical protein
MDVDSEEQSSDRAEPHFLAALVDELMKALLVKGVINRSPPAAADDAATARLASDDVRF